MAMSLIKACKQLEIGIATAVEYLQKQGIEVVENPNIKLSDEDYLTLVRGYNKTLADEIEAQKNKKVVVEEPKKVPATPQKEVITPTNDIHVKVVGRMDIEEKKAAASETEKEAMVESQKNDQVDAEQVAPVEEKTKAEKKSKQDTPKETEVQEQPKSEAKETHGKKKKRFEFSETEDGVVEVKVHNSELEKRPNVIGKLNLDEMNMSTHPAKKTKEEKKKEKEERLQNKKNQSQKDVADNAGSQDQNATEKTSRTRIKGKKSKIDVDNFDFKANKNNHNGKRSHRGYKNEISEEEVQRQVKETMSSFQTPKGKTNYSKYKRERRELEREKVALEKEIRAEQSKMLKLTEFVTVNDLAVMMNVPVVKVISTCMSIGIMVSINQRLEADTINLVAEEFGFTTEFVSAKVVEEIQQTEENYNEEDVERRAPIITVMGHVDHGKTSLLDHIRNTNVIAGEAGGITQHIGAYNVKLKNGQHLTFLDTPGHEAFTAMRARGAKVTDIAIIIIAADDAVMPQTVEAINHAQLAGVPMIFAINKCDKPGANPDKIKEQLANMNILVEDWGGKYQCQNISAKSGDGVFELLEKVLLEAEMLDLKANPKRRAKGSIIESSLDKGRGYVATVL
ncbi:MAG: translation initiation factor IF-2 N-terminal domain-containing protein, partial [Paludibacteraceae bacterium]|nr:translation initiation factor IF-2 N-terminal domain-containing protein [Paludibacteraceae bacterium]